MATLLVTQFTVSNGGEERNAQAQMAFRERFGKRWRKPYQDFREAEDPEAFTVAKRRFLSDRTGKPRKGLNAMPDFGSIKPRNPQVAGPNARPGRAGPRGRARLGARRQRAEEPAARRDVERGPGRRRS